MLFGRMEQTQKSIRRSRYKQKMSKAQVRGTWSIRSVKMMPLFMLPFLTDHRQNYCYFEEKANLNIHEVSYPPRGKGSRANSRKLMHLNLVCILVGAWTHSAKDIVTNCLFLEELFPTKLSNLWLFRVPKEINPQNKGSNAYKLVFLSLWWVWRTGEEGKGLLDGRYEKSKLFQDD